MRLHIDKDKAVGLLRKRITELNSYDYDPKVWKDRTEMDVKEIFGPTSLEWLKISHIELDTYLDSFKAKVRADGKITAKKQVESLIDFIEEHYQIKKEEIIRNEESFKTKYITLLSDWNSLVPKYNKMLDDYSQCLDNNKYLREQIEKIEINKDTIKILFLGANPSDQTRLRVDRELREIDLGLRKANERDTFILVQRWAVSPLDIQQALLDEDPDIVHFSGHGDQSGIVVEDNNGNTKIISGDVLAELFSLFAPKIKCVILNSCFSEQQAIEVVNHIPYVVGMNDTIADESALDFSIGFYAALGAGKDIEFAYKMGLVSIRLTGSAGADTPQLLTK